MYIYFLLRNVITYFEFSVKVYCNSKDSYYFYQITKRVKRSRFIVMNIRSEIYFLKTLIQIKFYIYQNICAFANNYIRALIM